MYTKLYSTTAFRVSCVTKFSPKALFDARRRGKIYVMTLRRHLGQMHKGRSFSQFRQIGSLIGYRFRSVKLPALKGGISVIHKDDEIYQIVKLFNSRSINQSWPIDRYSTYAQLCEPSSLRRNEPVPSPLRVIKFISRLLSTDTLFHLQLSQASLLAA